MDVAEAQHAMDGLDWQGAVKDIHAAVDWLKANGSKKVFPSFMFLLVVIALKCNSNLCSVMAELGWCYRILHGRSSLYCKFCFDT